MPKIEEYTANAETSRRMAAKASDPAERTRWLQTAEQWRRMTRRPLSDESQTRGVRQETSGGPTDPSRH